MSEDVVNELCNKLRESLGEALLELNAKGPRRVFMRVSRDDFKECLKKVLKIIEPFHISTISGVDYRDHIELIYHIWSLSLKVEVSIKVDLPRDNPVIETICDVIPGAFLYEREVYDLLGVTFEGHPDLKHSVLPEDWPEGVHPLRKDVPLSEVRKLMLRRS